MLSLFICIKPAPFVQIHCHTSFSSRLFYWSLICICIRKPHPPVSPPIRVSPSSQTHLPLPLGHSFQWLLLVSQGLAGLLRQVDSRPYSVHWKLKGKFLVLPMGLGRWAVDHRGVWTLPSLWPGESHTWAVCTCSNRSWINIRLFRSCRDRPLSCIICAWPTERRLGPKEREYRYWL